MKPSFPVPVTQKCRGVQACMILVIPLSLLLGTFSPVTATDGPLFAAPFLLFDTGADPYSVAIADLNGDGKPDLATANAANTVTVLLGNGDGSFGLKTDFGTGNNPISMTIGDLNGDGKPDLATANVNSGTVSVLLGKGDGSFGVKTDYGTGSYPNSVAIGDLNDDGKPDLAAANGGSSTISVLLGNGDGSFGVKTDYGTGESPRSVAIGDLNGDGKPDLATANSIRLGAVSVLLGNDDGSFGAKTDYGTGNNIYLAANSVAIGDLNGDGKLDLAAANSGSNTVSVLLNIGASSCIPTPMSLDLSPSTLNLRSMGHWVTATLEPEPPASPAAIDVSSIRLNGSVPVDASAPASIGDAEGDGRPDLTVKFDLAAVGLVVPEGEAVPVTVTGKIGSGCFEATDRIRVFRPHITSPSAGSELPGGSTTEVRWYTPADVRAQSVALLRGTSVGQALQGAVPNPGRGLSVSFSLHDARPATLAVYDVSGRELNRREVGNLGAGRHLVTLGAPGKLAPGIYLVHLIQGSRRLVARAVVVQ